MANPPQPPKPKRQRISWSKADVMELTQIVNGTSTINGKKMVNVIEEGSNKNNRILETLWDKVTSEFNRRTDNIFPPLSPCQAKKSSNHYQSEVFFTKGVLF